MLRGCWPDRAADLVPRVEHGWTPSRGFNHEEHAPQSPLEQGQADRAKGATQAQGTVGHTGKAPAIRAHTQPCPVTSRSIRSSEAATWSACVSMTSRKEHLSLRGDRSSA